MNLRPCPFRRVDDEGHILCDKIKSGDREVSPAICRACPISAINCAHLRATLNQQSRPPLTVRYGNGKTEIWDDPAPPIALERAACSAKVIPILSPRDCAGCAIRQLLVTADSIPIMPTVKSIARPIPIQVAQPVVIEEERKSVVAQKIIQIQEWLTKQKNTAAQKDDAEESVLPIAVGAGPLRRSHEEKRVGWTD